MIFFFYVWKLYILRQNIYDLKSYRLVEANMKEYKVNNIFNDNSITLNELIHKLLLTLIDNNLNISNESDIMSIQL